MRVFRWSLFSGIVALIRRRRRWERIARFEYAVSASSRAGRLRGRHDSLAFEPLMGRLRITRIGRGADRRW